MLAHDPLAQPLEGKPRQGFREPVEALSERTQQPCVPLGELSGERVLDARVERSPRRRAADEGEPVVRDADEGRREHGEERHVVVAVVEQAQVPEQVDHLLLAEVALRRGLVRRQTSLSQLLVVDVGIRAGGEEDDDLTGRHRTRVDELTCAPRNGAGFGAAPVDASVVVARLVGDEQLDRMPEHRVRELRRGVERLELVAEVGAEQLVDRCEHLWTRAVVVGQRQQLRRLCAPLAEHLHVGMPEAVDRLELVADVEQLGVRRAQQVDELALEPVRVLELVDHDRAEAPVLAFANLRVVSQQVARVQLEVLEVERRLACLRAGVRGREALEELLQQCPVARRRLVERSLRDGAPRLLVGGRPLAGGAEPGELHQPVGARVPLEQREQLLGVRALVVARRRVAGEAPGRLAQLLDALGELRAPADVEIELAAGGAKRLVDAREHPAKPVRAVGREQAQPIGRAVGAELAERLLERLAAEHRSLGLVELAEARVEPRRERVSLQQAQAEAMNGGDPGAVELAREIVPSALRECAAHPRPQLARRAPRVRDHEDGVDVDTALAHGPHEALDEHRRLAGACPGGDEHLAAGVDRGALLGVHARGTRHIGHRSHHVGQSPPFGSCTTSPVRIRPASLPATARAFSTAAQNDSSSR